jgi:hypothetical protein
MKSVLIPYLYRIDIGGQVGFHQDPRSEILVAILVEFQAGSLEF